MAEKGSQEPNEVDWSRIEARMRAKEGHAPEAGQIAYSLDRAGGDVQEGGDFLVGPAFLDLLQDLTFLVGEPAEPRPDRLLVGQQPAALDIILDGPLDLLQEGLAVEGLLDELDGAGLHGADGHWHISIGCDEDYRDVTAGRDQFPVELQAVHAGHLHV